jgi:hypothetical protein
MAFNILAESSNQLNYDLIHKELFSDNLPFELFPMPGLGKQNGDAVGICVSRTNAHANTWEILKKVIERLKTEFGCDVYDLYGGQKLDDNNVSMFRKNLIGD